jgi:hypothetical protein
MDFRMPMPDFTLDPAADAEEKLRQALGGNLRLGASALPRSRRASVGGTLTNSTTSTDELGSGRAMLAQALKMYGENPDITALNEFAAKRAKDGDSSMLNALAAQFAGEGFEPVQAQFLKRAAAAADPVKFGDYGYVAGGKFVADPFAARDKSASANMDAGRQIMVDDRADQRQADMFARQAAQAEAADRRQAAQIEAADRRQAAQLRAAENRANAREDSLLSKAERKEQEAQEKDRLRSQAKMAAADTVMDNVADAKDLLQKTWGGGITRATTSKVPGTDSYTLARRIDTIKANIGFDALAAMREASPTGGALGQVAVQELNYLQSTIANLDIGLPDEELEKSLDAVKRHYDNIKMVQRGVMPPGYPGSSQSKDSGKSPSGASKPPPGVDQNVWNAMTAEERALWKN